MRFTRSYGVALNTKTAIPIALRDRTTGLLVQPTLADTGVEAVGTLTVTVQPSNNETFTINSTATGAHGDDNRVYTWKTTLSTGPTVANEIKISATDLAGSLLNARAAINRDASGEGSLGEGTAYSWGTTRHKDAVSDATATGTTVVFHGPKSAAGNSIATTETMANGAWGAATLASGADSDVMIKLDNNVETSAFAQWTLLGHDGKVTLTAAQLRAAKTRIRIEDKSGTDFLDVEHTVETTDHPDAMEPNGVQRQVTPDAVPGATSFAVTDATLPSSPLGAGFINCVALIVASDVATDVTPASTALITSYSKTGNIGTFTYAGGWNRIPTGTAAQIRINLIAGAIGSTEKVGTVVDVRLLSASAKAALDLFAAILDQATGQLDEGSFAAGAIAVDGIAADALTLAKFATDLKARLLAAVSVTQIDAREAAAITGAVATDAGNAATGFEVDTSVGTDVRVGVLRLTSGALTGEARLVSWTGTTIAVLSHSGMPTALKQFSATPADAVTFEFRPL
ncbi:MAG: Cell wall surface anchor family protein [candidate division CPR1 bacterium GW2011_GWC1_49_13]|uniref:Cell wall surface anchor family protein n=1 Tax=candidate division CPR1 bacterium GW2011_GWC1_49_13 TaxID=1618342 RepID=A0A0G1YGY6_9BACT|nr:MAG: Cell wall surface anchor family protein [candidate division CPR1 bacterium GW2011_GWC1_49_13]